MGILNILLAAETVWSSNDVPGRDWARMYTGSCVVCATAALLCFDMPEARDFPAIAVCSAKLVCQAHHATCIVVHSAPTRSTLSFAENNVGRMNQETRLRFSQTKANTCMTCTRQCSGLAGTDTAITAVLLDVMFSIYVSRQKKAKLIFTQCE